MPNTTILEPSPVLDLRLVDMIAGIRDVILHLLRPDQPNPPSAGDVTLCLGVLDKVAGATCRLTETERIRADTKYVLALVEKVKAETDKIKEEKK